MRPGAARERAPPDGREAPAAGAAPCARGAAAPVGAGTVASTTLAGALAGSGSGAAIGVAGAGAGLRRRVARADRRGGHEHGEERRERHEPEPYVRAGSCLRALRGPAVPGDEARVAALRGAVPSRITSRTYFPIAPSLETRIVMRAPARR